MADKLSERLEARLALRAGVPDFIKEPAYVDSEECRALLREAAELARRVEGAAVAKVRGKVGDVCMVPVSHDYCGQRVRLVPDPPGQEVPDA